MRWKQAVTIIAGLALLGVLPAPAQKSDPAEVLLEAARKKEVLEGDLEAAIRQYKEILARIDELLAILGSDTRLMEVIREELGFEPELPASERDWRSRPLLAVDLAEATPQAFKRLLAGLSPAGS
jgi:hypothetical protein